MTVALPASLGTMLSLARQRAHASTVAASATQWDELIRVGRSANLLGMMAVAMERGGGLDAVPEGPRNHLQGALALSRQQAVSVRWEARKIRAALAEVPERLVLLKGAAYLAEGLSFATGRAFSDVDILVPVARIDEAEEALLRHGWGTTHHTEYDETYYRRWMHEIPPLRHLERGTVIDVHHRILPRTARFAPDPDRMLERAQPSRCWPGAYVLCREDMLLHSATHLFHEGEMHNGFRDLLDIDSLVATFAVDPNFWAALRSRAAELGLEEPLRVILRQATQLLGTPVPQDLVGNSKTWIDAAYARALLPAHALCETPGTPFARWLVYVRGHALRMPPHLLVYHLSRKAMRRWTDADETANA